MTDPFPEGVLRLCAANLPAIAAAGVPVPQYDRSGVTAGIVHFGVGGFHRAHLAMLVDLLLQAGEARDFGICGVGVLEQDRRMARVMADQDHLYTLALKHADGTREHRVIGSIVDYLFAPEDPEAVVERMARPEVRIVSMTITEGGYDVDQSTGLFRAGFPEVQRDLANPDAPMSVFGLVLAALRRRRQQGIRPFTVVSCDNMEHNGEVARAAFTGFARLVDPDLAAWMQAEVAFPSSMVDRITPATTDEDRLELAEDLGVLDAWPVVAEPFFQWVLEDRFPAGRPPFEHGGAQLVDDVEPYELMKLRLLNASHQAMGYFGTLLGHRYAHEAAQDPDIAGFLRRYMDEEATPTLPPVPDIDLEQYKATLLERFSNPEIRDTLARLCAETSDRIPKFLLPVARENLDRNGPVALVAAVCASWDRYAQGVDEQGERIEVVDRLAEQVRSAAADRTDPVAFLRIREVFGDLAEEPRFRDAFTVALAQLQASGSRAVLRAGADGRTAS